MCDDLSHTDSFERVSCLWRQPAISGLKCQVALLLPNRETLSRTRILDNGHGFIVVKAPSFLRKQFKRQIDKHSIASVADWSAGLGSNHEVKGSIPFLFLRQSIFCEILKIYVASTLV